MLDNTLLPNIIYYILISILCFNALLNTAIVKQHPSHSASPSAMSAQCSLYYLI